MNTITLRYSVFAEDCTDLEQHQYLGHLSITVPVGTPRVELQDIAQAELFHMSTELERKRWLNIWPTTQINIYPI